MQKSELGWVGNIAYAQPGGRGEYPGAVCMRFWSLYTFNRFFKKNPKLLVIDVTYQKFLGLWTTVVAMVTNQLSPEELEDMNEVSREIEFAMAERRQKRREAELKQKQEQDAKKLEVERLAEVGRKYEERVAHIKTMSPTDPERKNAEKALNGGDPNLLFRTCKEAYEAGYVTAMSLAATALAPKKAKENTP